MNTKMTGIGLGCDIVFIPRLAAALKRTPTFAQKTFTSRELQTTSVNSLAGIYAAKEAIIKALGLSLKDIGRLEIKKDRQSRPYGTLDHERLDNLTISISHDGEYALAVALNRDRGQITSDAPESLVNHTPDLPHVSPPDPAP